MLASRHGNEFVLSKICNEWKAVFALFNAILKRESKLCPKGEEQDCMQYQ